jgi:putative phosphoserine phosphatase/1-acylglycerol-3-phosphate O-acyltransferase
LEIFRERGPARETQKSLAGGSLSKIDKSSRNMAAFFDVDGVLVPEPSLEMRLFRSLRARRILGLRNYFCWLAESLRLVSQGPQRILHANKAYLRGIAASAIASAAFLESSDVLFEEAIERVTWHAQQGHRVVLVTGTLEPLALQVATRLRAALRRRGVDAVVHVCATRLAEQNGRWSGRIEGEAVFGKEKARMIEKLAADLQLDLAECFAYGDGANDRWMLALVGHAFAVNASDKLLRIARLSGWPVIHWSAAVSRDRQNTRDYSEQTERARPGKPARNPVAPALPEIPR